VAGQPATQAENELSLGVGTVGGGTAMLMGSLTVFKKKTLGLSSSVPPPASVLDTKREVKDTDIFTK